MTDTERPDTVNPDTVKADDAHRVLFVCLGNICRSPTGEGVLRHILAERDLDGAVHVDSAGTGAWHVGEQADSRMRRAASRRGYDLTSRARQVTVEDFHDFHLVVAMDRSNLSDLEEIRPAGSRADLRLFSDFLPAGSPEDVPDPYYGGEHGFDQVLDLVEEGAANLLEHLLSGDSGNGNAKAVTADAGS